MEPDALTPALAAARDRRIDLREALVHLERAISAPTPGREAAWASKVEEELAVLVAAFEGHVEATEGDGGLYAEILDWSPRLENRVTRLHEDHGTIREEIETCRRKLAAMAAGEVAPGDVRAATMSLMARVVRHRELGADLVYEAYQVDIGAGE